MANPQPENGYTRIANEIMEALARIRLPGTAVQVLMLILRETYGVRGRKEVCFRPGYISKKTGLSRSQTYKATHCLISNNLISVCEKGYTSGTTYRFNKDYDTYVCEKGYGLAYAKKDTGVCEKETSPYKETIKKPKRYISPSNAKNPKPKNNKKTAKKSTQFPASFSLTDKLKKYATEKEIENPELEFEHFKNHHIAKGSLFRDWERAWYTWVINGKKFKKNSKGEKCSYTSMENW